ncbi:MAG: hypothetical protein Q9M48_11375 [Rhodobacterales bacterium]|nr:hypothetical protein [Rhodobacterales bacterium]
MDFDIDARYEQRIKTLYSAIVEFSTRVSAIDMPTDLAQQIYQLRDVSGQIVRAVKSVKHLRRNATYYTARPQGAVTDIYNDLRTEIARILVEISKLDLANEEDRSSLWLEQERVQIERDSANTSLKIEGLIREKRLGANAATSFLNDSGYAYNAMRDLIEAARIYYVETNSAMAEVERFLTLDEDEVESIVSQTAQKGEANMWAGCNDLRRGKNNVNQLKCFAFTPRHRLDAKRSQH